MEQKVKAQHGHSVHVEKGEAHDSNNRPTKQCK